MTVSKWLLRLDLCHDPVPLAIQEAKEGETHVKVFTAYGELKDNMDNSVRPYLKIKKLKEKKRNAWDLAKHLPNKHKALGSTPAPINNEKEFFH